MKPVKLGVESIKIVQLNPTVLSVRVVKYKLELGFHILFDDKTDLVLFVMDYDSMGLTSVVRTEVEPEKLLESEERLSLIVGNIIEEFYYISYGEKYKTLRYDFLFKNIQKMFESTTPKSRAWRSSCTRAETTTGPCLLPMSR